MLLGEMTMKEFSEALRRTQTVVIPFGTIEAHGNHLPTNTDTLVIREVVKKAAGLAGVFMAPPLQYGVCTSTGDHPGTLGITPRTLRAFVKDVVQDGISKGLRSFVLISGHGGSIHVSAMKEAGEALVAANIGISISACSIYEMLGADFMSIIETKNDSHAGEGETSLIMHLAPTLVKGTSPEEYPKFTKPAIAKDKLKQWPGAVWGDPEKASAEKGRAIFDLMVAKTIEIIRATEDAR